MEKLKIRKPYEASIPAPMAEPGQSMAKQYMKDECDINNILRQYQKTGVINHVKENQGQYVDLPQTIDYQEALNIVIGAGEAFDNLPGSVRQRFNNDASAFLEFMDDEKNMDESYELGLREREYEEPEEMEIVDLPLEDPPHDIEK